MKKTIFYLIRHLNVYGPKKSCFFQFVFLIQTHCTEIRRQVQLAKETSIQKIEEQTEQLIDRINTFECESLDTLLKTDKDQFISKLNEIKNENEKWNKHLNEYKIDLELFDDLRNSLSKFAIERENINYLLFKSKLLEFKPIENIDIGRLSTVVIDSFEHKICLSILLCPFKKPA